MAIYLKKLCWTLILCLRAAQATFAFSLLGPFVPWMTPHVGFVQDEAYDVGGPRNIGDEFRWNVPVLTYGFDEEFKDFFGPNGITAVEGAIAILNALPPASQMDLSKAPLETLRIHSNAQSAGLFDLKSIALVSLVEQTGLANSMRYTWITTSTNVPVRGKEETGPHDSIVRRNFDPFDLTPSSYVNNARFTYEVGEFGSQSFPMFADPNRVAVPFEIDQAGIFGRRPVSGAIPDVLGFGLRQGEYFFALSRDDFGGFKYLLDTNNVNVEETVSGVSANEGGVNFVKAAARPGIDKITFQRLDPGGPLITNVFEDVYFLDGQRRTQLLQRAIRVPDILFTASDNPRQFGSPPSLVRRTRPNFSHQNETGSGILQPEVAISFHKLGNIYREPYYEDAGGIIDPRWGSFDSRTVTLTNIFPQGPKYQGGRTMGVRKLVVEGESFIEWTVRLIQGVRYAVETSADLVKWTEVGTIPSAPPVHTLTNSVPGEGSAIFLRTRRISGQ